MLDLTIEWIGIKNSEFNFNILEEVFCWISFRGLRGDLNVERKRCVHMRHFMKDGGFFIKKSYPLQNLRT